MLVEFSNMTTIRGLPFGCLKGVKTDSICLICSSKSTKQTSFLSSFCFCRFLACRAAWRLAFCADQVWPGFGMIFDDFQSFSQQRDAPALPQHQKAVNKNCSTPIGKVLATVVALQECRQQELMPLPQNSFISSRKCGNAA